MAAAPSRTASRGVTVCSRSGTGRTALVSGTFTGPPPGTSLQAADSHYIPAPGRPARRGRNHRELMDFGQRPNGGAGALVNAVKSFAAAGIANRVVALFDNDTAAADALRSWDRSRLPANIRLCQYPSLDLGASYPALAASLGRHDRRELPQGGCTPDQRT